MALVGANASFLIGSKDEDEEVGASLQIVASLQIGAKSFIQSRLFPSSLEVYLTCLFLLVGGGGGDGDGDGAGAGSRLHHFEDDGPLLLRLRILQGYNQALRSEFVGFKFVLDYKEFS